MSPIHHQAFALKRRRSEIGETSPSLFAVFGQRPPLDHAFAFGNALDPAKLGMLVDAGGRAGPAGGNTPAADPVPDHPRPQLLTG